MIVGASFKAREKGVEYSLAGLKDPPTKNRRDVLQEAE
jgi:hypothetical protein